MHSLFLYQNAFLVSLSGSPSVMFASDLRASTAPAAQTASLTLRSSSDPSVETSASITHLVYHRAYPDIAFIVLKDEVKHSAFFLLGLHAGTVVGCLHKHQHATSNKQFSH